MEYLVEDLKSVKGICVVLNYSVCIIYFICILLWLYCLCVFYIFLDILIMEKSEVESKI